MSKGDAFIDEPLQVRPDDSLAAVLDRALLASLPLGTSYETVSNTVLKVTKLFNNEFKKGSDMERCKNPTFLSQIQKFCRFLESTLNETQVRLSRRAVDICLGLLVRWIRCCPNWILNDVFHALGAILYGAGTMTDSHREMLLINEGAILNKVSRSICSSLPV